jgi:hypothetical protein
MDRQTRRYARLDQRANHALRAIGVVCMLLVVSVIVLGVAPAARATDRGTATAVLTSQLGLLQKQRPLNKCLAASPRKNTPCIRQKSLALAAWAGRDIKAIQAAIDGTEKDCVRAVALQEIGYVGMWRKGALALYRNERKKARRIFLDSLKIADAQKQLQLTCFTGIFTGP